MTDTVKEQIQLAKLEALQSLTAKNKAETYSSELEGRFRERRLADEEASSTDAHVYYFHGAVNALSSSACLEELGHWSRKDPGCDITIVFNSPGGSVFEGLALFDFIVDLRGRGHHVTTKSVGMAASMGGILLQAGDVRVIGKNGFMLIHEVSSGAMGKVSEMEDALKFAERLQVKLVAILSERSSLTDAQIRRRWKQKDWWLDAAEALELGFVDRIEE